MRAVKTHLITVCLILGMNVSAIGQIHKWTDENGVVHYSDAPIKKSAKVETSVENTANTELNTPLPAVPSSPKEALSRAPAEKHSFFSDNNQTYRIKAFPGWHTEAVGTHDDNLKLSKKYHDGTIFISINEEKHRPDLYNLEEEKKSRFFKSRFRNAVVNDVELTALTAKEFIIETPDSIHRWYLQVRGRYNNYVIRVTGEEFGYNDKQYTHLKKHKGEVYSIVKTFKETTSTKELNVDEYEEYSPFSAEFLTTQYKTPYDRSMSLNNTSNGSVFYTPDKTLTISKSYLSNNSKDTLQILKTLIHLEDDGIKTYANVVFEDELKKLPYDLSKIWIAQTWDRNAANQFDQINNVLGLSQGFTVTVLPEETYQNKTCRKIEYLYPTGDRVQGLIWKEKNVPLKFTALDKNNELILETSYSNIKLGPIDDDVFELPKDAVISDK